MELFHIIDHCIWTKSQSNPIEFLISPFHWLQAKLNGSKFSPKDIIKCFFGLILFPLSVINLKLSQCTFSLLFNEVLPCWHISTQLFLEEPFYSKYMFWSLSSRHICPLMKTMLTLFMECANLSRVKTTWKKYNAYSHFNIFVYMVYLFHKLHLYLYLWWHLYSYQYFYISLSVYFGLYRHIQKAFDW